MALKDYQTTLTVNRLYEVNVASAPSGIGGQLNPSIWANNDISVYGSNSATQPAALSAMVLEAGNTDVKGNLALAKGVSALPRYIAITTSTATEIIATGLSVRDLGAIA